MQDKKPYLPIPAIQIKKKQTKKTLNIPLFTYDYYHKN